MNRMLRNGLVVFVGLMCAASTWGATIFQRGLPSSLNSNVAEPNRSNVSWGNQGGGVSGGGFINGDSFTLPGSGSFLVDVISVFLVLNNPGDIPTTEFSDFRLYLGVDNGNGNPGTFGLAASSASFTQVFYGPTNPGGPCNGPSGESYLSGPSTCLPIYQLNFTVNQILTAGVSYVFAADGTPIGNCIDGGDTSGCFFSHATNAGLAGVPQQGSNGLYLNWDATALNAGYIAIDSNGNGWNKSSDINVLVDGTLVPEPSTLGMLGLGIAALIGGAVRRRKK